MKKTLLLAAFLLSTLTLTACNNTKSSETSQASITATTEPAVQEMIDFGRCLTDKGATFYGTEWCGHCKNQKSLLGDGLVEVKFVDCDQQQARCIKAGIQGYPTWVLADGEQLVGAQPLAKLAEATGCAAPSV
jgi:glutaredoxin